MGGLRPIQRGGVDEDEFEGRVRRDGNCDLASISAIRPRIRHKLSEGGAFGEPTRIFTFLNCMFHKPWYGTAFVEHGSIAYKEVTQRRCGNADEPARDVWYTSPPGYKGTDTVTFPFGSSSTVFNISVQRRSSCLISRRSPKTRRKLANRASKGRASWSSPPIVQLAPSIADIDPTPAIGSPDPL
jgi:hypothetical protein